MAAHLSEHRRHGVRRERGALCDVEALECLGEAEQARLDEVVVWCLAGVAPGELVDQRQHLADEVLTCAAVAPAIPAQQPSPPRVAVLSVFGRARSTAAPRLS